MLHWVNHVFGWHAVWVHPLFRLGMVFYAGVFFHRHFVRWTVLGHRVFHHHFFNVLDMFGWVRSH